MKIVRKIPVSSGLEVMAWLYCQNNTENRNSGSITVYYDNAGTKEEWFTLQAGENVEGTLDNLGEGKVYIIVETDGKCEEGKLEFEVE